MTSKGQRIFNEQERAVLDGFKDQYMDTRSPAARKDLAKDKIFPGIFNYWKGVGIVYTKPQEVIKKAVCQKLKSN